MSNQGRPLTEVFGENLDFTALARFEDELLALICDLRQPVIETPRRRLRESAERVMAAWGKLTNQEVEGENGLEARVQFRIRMRRWDHLPSEFGNGSHSMRL